MSHQRFVSAWPSTYLYDSPEKGAKKITQCLWGDWARLEPGADPTQERVPVRTRGTSGWLGADELSEERLLEVNFVDVGQGDGAFIVTPDDTMVMIDAGESENMYRFLKWRFNLKAEGAAPLIALAIITHPDQDHYAGFQKLFADERFKFKAVRHNGIVERAGGDNLGPTTKVGDLKYLTDIVDSEAELRALLEDSDNRGAKKYPKLLWTALESRRVGSVKATKKGDVLLQESPNGKALSLKALAPVREKVGGKDVLRRFGSADGPTKNGHSVVTMLQYGQVRVLLGGDLNIPAEEYLMEKYAAEPGAFSADVAKACHHGSADFTTAFLDLIRPVATVVSSGDDEPHSHPRADSLGTIGKHSRGERALIFSTELARSAPERIIDAHAVRHAILGLADKAATGGTAAERKKAREKLVTRLEDVVQRSVEMYGMITLRTDGDRVVIAQRLEQARGATKWDVYPLKRDGNGELTVQSKH